MRALLSFGSDILLHNYTGQTPLDLAIATAREGQPAMRDYLCNLIADLHGRPPSLRSREVVKVKRWNVSHARDFHDPTHPESGIQKKAPSRRREPEEFVFSCSSQPTHLLPTTYQLADRLGHWLILRDVKDYAKKTGQSRLANDLKNKGELLELPKAEFLRSSHCSLLVRRAVEVRGQERDQEVVTLVKEDAAVRKILNTELVTVS